MPINQLEGQLSEITRTLSYLKSCYPGETQKIRELEEERHRILRELKVE
jgi:hypothetical protein